MEIIKIYVRKMHPKTECPPRKPATKILWSWLGAFLGIYLIAKGGEMLADLNLTDQIFLIGSFGASAVLVYGAPQADFSQPRNLVLGHVVSAIAGVTVFKLCPQPDKFAFTAALAVSLGVVGMHVTRSIHPPGGATALIAVMPGDKIHKLGYLYAFCPVFVGTLVLLLVALAINNLSQNPKRYYPNYWY